MLVVSLIPDAQSMMQTFGGLVVRPNTTSCQEEGDSRA